MVPMEGTNWAVHDRELFLSLARRLLGLVVWYGLNVATFGGFSCSKPPLPMLPPTPSLRWTEISAH